MIDYRSEADAITPDQLIGFFVGWPDPPSPETHLQILRCSSHIEVAVDTGSVRVVGFINAISDGVLAAYIPLLEVLPEYQHRGIGSELLRRLFARLDGFYMVDLVCDPEVQPFYERLGLRKASAMVRRDLSAQSGRQAGT